MPPEDRPPDLRVLLEGAWSLEMAERESWLREACGEDLTLFERARSLLDATDVPDGFLGTPLEDLRDTAGPVPEGAELRAGTRLGPWRLEEELGRGGMGVVWRAARDDEAFERRVAIKVLHRGSADRELVLRFRRECALQASLEHPGIARLVDSGIGPADRPYLVLEHVEGEPLDEWVRRRDPAARERLELFVRICEAVHHAHKRLVVHRDLKPANVLVTADGEPKLLDFGIAKLLQEDEGATWADLTRDEQRLFTPSYASPEQLRGEPVGVASDVYSLGVLLYELLVGERPFDFRDASWAERLRIVSEERPTPPSAVAARAERTPDSRVLPTGRLQGDLDAIVLTALRAEPERRYGSAEAFADDLRRHLDGLPVRARPDTIGYRTSRFLGRHRLAVGVGAVALVALLVSFAVTVVQYLDAERARKLAETRLARIEALADDLEGERAAAVQRAEELGRLTENLNVESERAQRRFDDVRRFATDLVFDVHGMLVDVPGSIAARERVLQIGARHLASLGEEAGDDPELQAELAGAWLRLGDSQGDPVESNVGDMRAAAESYGRALELARGLAETPAFEPARALRMELLATTRLADARELLEGPAAAIELLEAAVPVAGSLVERDAAGRADLESAALLLDRLAKHRTRAGRLEEAAALLSELGSLHARIEAESGGDERLRTEGIVLSWRTADVERARGDHELALELDRSALERALAAPLSPGADRMRRVGRGRVGADLLALERGAEAIELLVENVRELDQLLRLQPSDARTRIDLAINLGSLALANEDAGRLEAAVEPALRAVDLAAELVQSDPANQESSQLLVVKSLDAARIAARADRPDAADGAVACAREELARRLDVYPGWLDLLEASRAATHSLAELVRGRVANDERGGAPWRTLARTAATLLEVHELDPRAEGRSAIGVDYAELVRIGRGR